MVVLPTLLAQASSSATIDSVIGKVTAPQGVDRFNRLAGGGNPDTIGLLLFLSYVLRVFTIVAGIWVMINFFIAAYDYINSGGNTQAHTKVKDRLTMSMIGLIIIVGSYTIAGIIGLVFFGDASFILNPVLQGPK
jgi:hypothetical protein